MSTPPPLVWKGNPKTSFRPPRRSGHKLLVSTNFYFYLVDVYMMGSKEAKAKQE